MTQTPEEIKEILKQLKDAESKLSPQERLELMKELTVIVKDANVDLRKIRQDVDVAVDEGKQKQEILRKINGE